MKNTLLFLLFLSIPSSNCLAIRDITKISKPEQTYYENNREWEYLERILIKNIDQVDSKTKTIINYIAKGVFIVPFALLNYLLINDTPDVASCIFFEICFTIVSGLTSFITKTIGHSIKHKKILNQKFVNTLEMFLQKYNSKMHTTDYDNDDINYKKIIPEELHETFNLLYNRYITHGKMYLEENSLEILESITDKIKYEIKPKKYKEISKNRRAELNRISESIDTSILAASISSSRK